MVRRWIILTLTLFVALHMGGQSFAAAPEDLQLTIVSLLESEPDPSPELPDRTDEVAQPAPAHCSTSCHDHCKGFTYWSFDNTSANRQTLSCAPATDVLTALVNTIVPPPQ